jgi:hypothetical protein
VKVAEILRENGSYLKEMESFVLDLLVAYRAERISEVDLKKLVRDVRDAGFPAVDQEFLADYLGRIPWVERVDVENNKIILDHDDDQGEEGEEPAEEPVDAAETKVSDEARKVASADMKGK